MIAIRKLLDKCLEFICSVVFVVMILVVLYQIFVRTVLGNPNTVTEEFVKFSLVWLSLLASAYVVGKRSHLSVSLLSDHLNPQKQRILDTVVQILFVLFAAVVMIFGGFKAVSVTMGQLSPSLGIPMGLIYLAVPVSGILILVYSLLNLIQGKPQEESEG
ncbi:TRAP transporter small permease [Streptococcus merionis]|uniref:TRAP transporter small permease n=1 Tax=Streptococcus merionis TaxID=400065 RepID=UPI0026EC3628|nr:TRAP transporter small permease [Streptococcus merionis]